MSEHSIHSQFVKSGQLALTSVAKNRLYRIREEESIDYLERMRSVSRLGYLCSFSDIRKDNLLSFFLHFDSSYEEAYQVGFRLGKHHKTIGKYKLAFI